jgi:large subunit ribosomal protein L15|tara:strand:- start:1916 stop:2356 length:441 start_codon:yes stop_codon:yes gene_type:complete
MKLSLLKPTKGATSNRKRVGRGHGSGLGRTAGRGEKGYHSRSGSKHRPWFEGGQMPLHRRLPKRGFSNYLFRKQYQIVNLRVIGTLNEDEVDSKKLFDNGLISSSLQPVKVLGDGELKKAIKIKATSFSKSAVSKIEKAGGTVEIQ